MYPFVHLFIIKVTFSAGGEGEMKMLLMLLIFTDSNDSVYSILSVSVK